LNALFISIYVYDDDDDGHRWMGIILAQTLLEFKLDLYPIHFSKEINDDYILERYCRS
jgi:hypothetical protein